MRRLLLLFVAYHPSEEEVECLYRCLDKLPIHIGYAIVANDYREGEYLDKLIKNSDYFLANTDNLGYGAATNRLVKILSTDVDYLGILNTDIYWDEGTFDIVINWLDHHQDVVLFTPKL